MEQKTKHHTLLNIIILFFIVIFGIGAILFIAKFFKEFTLINFLGSFVCIKVVWILFQVEYKIFRTLNGEDTKEIKEVYLPGIARLIPYILIIFMAFISNQTIKIDPSLEKYNFDIFVGSLVSSLIFLIFHLFIGANEKEYPFSNERITYLIKFKNKFWFLTFKSWSKLIVAIGFAALTMGLLSSINSFYENFTWPITFLYIYIAFFSYFREKREEYRHLNLNFKYIVNFALEKLKIYGVIIRNIFVGEPSVSLYKVKVILFLGTAISLIISIVISYSSTILPETKKLFKFIGAGFLFCYSITMFLFQRSFKNSFQKKKILKIILLIAALILLLPFGSLAFVVAIGVLGIYPYKRDKRNQS